MSSGLPKPLSTIAEPAAASARAMPSPMPLVEPVTSDTLPSSDGRADAAASGACMFMTGPFVSALKRARPCHEHAPCRSRREIPARYRHQSQGVFPPPNSSLHFGGRCIARGEPQRNKGDDDVQLNQTRGRGARVPCRCWLYGRRTGRRMPGRQAMANAPKPVDFIPSGVTDTTLGAIDLGKEQAKIKGRELRFRKMVIQPGGVVPWHSHDDRPALIYVAEGEIIEYASNCAVPIVHKAGETRAETQRHVALVEEPHRQAGDPVHRRRPPRSGRPPYVTRPPRSLLSVSPRRSRRGFTRSSPAGRPHHRPWLS